MTPLERAEKSAAAMWSQDHASKALGMSIDAIAPGEATLSLIVRRDHLNGQGACHGGVIFALADSAFAFACNSHNLRCVAQHNMITYIAPGLEGQRLVAEAREVSRQGRSGVYDVRVSNEAGVIAEFRGCSRQVSGQHFEENS